MKHLTILTLVLALLSTSTLAQNKPPFLQYLDDPWVNQHMSTMTMEQKIGQLFIAQAYSNQSETDKKVLGQVIENQVGGIIFMQGSALNQANISNELQAASNIPLLICTDGEWGAGMRLKDYPNYPYQMTLGALAHDSLIYQMGREIGQQFRRMGVHVNFAPVSDVNNNPENPVINYRSFGADPKRVAQKAWQYAQGMEDEKVLPVLKHFPGHGDTSVDSHVGLPVIKHDIAHLDSVELYPFREMAQLGASSIMTGHIQIPALEPNEKLPASLSQKIITQKLKHEIGFEGIIFTDAMNMSGVTAQHAPGDAAVLAIKAGNDLLEICPDIPAAIEAVKKAVATGELSAENIDYHCRRVLALKKWLELDTQKAVKTEDLMVDLLQPRYDATRQQLHAQSITALLNKNQILPLQRLDTLRIASVTVGDLSTNSFQKMLGRYTQVSHFSLSKVASNAEVDALMEQLKDYNLIIAGIHGLRLTPKNNYGTTSTMHYFLQQASQKTLITTVFGNAYVLDKMPNIKLSSALLLSYQDNDNAQEQAAQAIFGAIGVNGKLPVGVNELFQLNDGLEIPKINRLRYALPAELNIPADKFNQLIDSIVEAGINKKAYPGCQVLIAIDGQVALNKSYGTHTYDGQEAACEDDLYDIASITKISSVTPALMKLVDEKKFNLDYPLSFYYPEFRNTNKEKITSREVLAHQARLSKWIPFWRELVALEDGKFEKVFHTEESKKYKLEIADKLYIDEYSRQLVYEIIRDSDLRSDSKYAYSDLGFMIYPQIIEELTGEEFPKYLNKTFFHPLGAQNIMYQPLKQVALERIPPTEIDKSFRRQTVQGHVHDEGAAMLGGISGNAGLFANANDLAKLMQMYLQSGSYGGVQYIDSATVAEFTRCQYPKNDNRRGLGFDKPYIDNAKQPKKDRHPCSLASPESFGHTGFTGSIVWLDPVKKITFIFLSNRTYPDRSTNLSKYEIRAELLDTIYKAVR